MKCMACGVEKDLAVLEVYPFPDMGLCDDPIPPLLALYCAPTNGSPSDLPGRVVVVCHQCFEKLDPDMWTSKDCWEQLNPVTPFEALPLSVDGLVETAENYGGNFRGEGATNMGD